MKKQIKWMVLTVMAALLVLTISSCKKPEENVSGKSKSGSGYPITARDGVGRKVVIKKPIERIVSLSPSNTEILFALGLGDKVVGVDDFSDFPEEANDKERIGGFANPNIEKIVDLKPDLVLADATLQAKEVAALKKLNIIVFSLDSKRLEDVVSAITKVGKITGSDVQAKIKTDEMTERIDKVIAKTRRLMTRDQPKVFFELYNEPLMTVGPSSFIGDMISLAGGDNITGSTKEEYPQFSLETLIARDPHVYLAASGSMTNPGDLKNRPGWENLWAVKNDAVFILDENIINRPGPRVAEGLELVARAIHPELFKD